LNVDPYPGFDIRGKWLLVSGSPVPAGRGAPRPDPALGKVGIDYTTINEVARFGGALGIITVATDSARALWARREVTGQDLNPSVGVAYAHQVPRISISTSALAKLLAGTSRRRKLPPPLHRIRRSRTRREPARGSILPRQP
jgi:hypothetical protein